MVSARSASFLAICLLCTAASIEITQGAKTWESVASGVFVTCLIDSDRQAYCMGNNDDGAVGDGTFNARLKPTLVKGNHKWRQVSAGDWSAGGSTLNSPPKAYAWGYNGGRLGIGRPNPVQADVPTALRGSYDFYSAGHFHGCGIKLLSGGIKQAYCWGQNRNGRLGNGETTSPKKYDFVPSPVVNGEGMDLVLAKGSHTMGLKRKTNTAYIWGGNTDGEVGNGEYNKAVTTPYELPGEWTYIEPGLKFSCMINPLKELYCTGKLAGGTNVVYNFGNTPKKMAGNTNLKWKTVTGGFQHFCGTVEDDTARCVGLSYHGQTAIGKAKRNSDCSFEKPCKLSKPYDTWKWKSLSAGEYWTCGVRDNGAAYCWGENPYGQLGVGSVGGNKFVPTKVLEP